MNSLQRIASALLRPRRIMVGLAGAMALVMLVGVIARLPALFLLAIVVPSIIMSIPAIALVLTSKLRMTVPDTFFTRMLTRVARWTFALAGMLVAGVIGAIIALALEHDFARGDRSLASVRAEVESMMTAPLLAIVCVGLVTAFTSLFFTAECQRQREIRLLAANVLGAFTGRRVVGPRVARLLSFGVSRWGILLSAGTTLGFVIITGAAVGSALGAPNL